MSRSYLIFIIKLVLIASLGNINEAFCQIAVPKSANKIELDPVVVTATATPTKLSNITASVTIITQEEIEARHADNLVELLQQVPGVYADQPGSRGGLSSVYIRGGDPNFTLILIDGIKVNDPTNNRGGSFDLSTMSTDSIERIEIVRGPLSALYGSDAISGVINIITKQGKAKPIINSELSFGRFGQFQALAQANGSKGITEFSISASYIDEGEPVEGSKFKSPTFNSNLGLILPGDIEVNSTFQYSHIDSSSFPDDSGGPEFAVIRSVEESNVDQFTLGINVNHTPLSWWEYTFKFGFYNSEEEISSPGVAPGIRDPFGIPPSRTDNDFSRYEFTLLNGFSLYEDVKFVLGLDLEFEDGLSQGLLFGEFPTRTTFKLDRYILSPLVELQLSFIPNFLLHVGAREDFPEGFDSVFSPGVGGSYKIEAINTILRCNWGEGFKLPSFFALGNPIVGNPGLEPERSQSFDIGVTQNFWGDRFSGTVTYFYNEFKDLIDFEEGPPPRLVNRSKVISQGFEMILNIQPWEILRLRSQLTYDNTYIKGTDEELRNRPEWWGGFSIWFKPLKAIDINLNALFVGKVLDSSIPTGDVELDPYSRFDLALTWKPQSNLKFYLAVENLFDEDYEQFVGFPAPGITPRIGIQARF